MSEKQKVQLEVDGCDGTTSVELELTPEELEFVTKLCKLVSDTSMSNCEPTMRLDRE